jgi:hydroxyacylglutathione hydrolase
VPVYGPALEAAEVVTQPLDDGARVLLPELDATFEVLHVPGHTLGHVAYYRLGELFCGDTLFGAGCGRVFEGTSEQMQASLARLAALPADTRVYCAHEYTQSCLRFAATVEPGNAAIGARAEHVARLRAAGRPSVPATLAEELATNPFLRWGAPAVRAAAAARLGHAPADDAATFAAIRAWRDSI